MPRLWPDRSRSLRRSLLQYDPRGVPHIGTLAVSRQAAAHAPRPNCYGLFGRVPTGSCRMLDSKASRMGTGVAAVTESASAREAAEAVTAARIEDLEEALRRIVVVLQPDGRHQLCDRDLAAIAVAC